MPNKELGIADPVYDALRIRSGQSIAPDLGGGSTGTGGIENKIYIWHADGSTIDLFDPTGAGVNLANTAAASGDTIWLPSMSITLSGALTVASGISIVGITMLTSILVGDVTNNGTLTNLSITGHVTNNALMQDVTVNVSSGVGITQAGGNLKNVFVVASGTTTYSVDFTAGSIENVHTSYSGGTPTGIRVNVPSVQAEINRCLFAGETGCEFITGPLVVVSNCQFAGTSSGDGFWYTGSGTGKIANSFFRNSAPATGGFGLDVDASGLELTDCAWSSIDGLANILFGEGDRAPRNVVPTDTTFISNLQNGTLSSELFTLAHGVNEFDLIYAAGAYHWFYTTYEVGNFKTHHRSASTVMGLATATDTEIFTADTLLVPTAQYIGTTWHVWGGTTSGYIYHYTASNPDGPYTLADTVSSGGTKGDPHVRQWLIDGNYYMAYVGDFPNWRIGIQRSSSPGGPWTDLGFIFSVLGKESWYTLEADPAIFFIGSRAYVSFSGWNGTDRQRCGLVEVNTTTWKALTAGTIIVEPSEAWMQRNGANRVFNPVWLEHDGLFYFSHNPYNGGYAPSVVTGWGYKQPANASLSILDTATVDLTLTGQLLTADVIPGGINAADLNSGAATDGQVLMADGASGAAWEGMALNDLSDVDTTGTGTGDVIYNSGAGWVDYPLGVGSKITVSGTKIRFGNIAGGNYLEIDSVTGTLRLAGDATTYDDFRVEASVVKPGATAPNWKAFGPSGNLQALMFEASHHDEAYFEMQMPHNWKLGTNIYPHVHWTPVNATAGNVVWELEYSWANVGDAFGAPGNMASDATAAGGVAWVHKLTDLKSGGNNYIDGTGKTLSSMLECRIHRNSNSGSDTLNQDVALLEVDFHYQIDSLGSDEPLVKDASASLLLETGDILLLETGDRLLLE